MVLFPRVPLRRALAGLLAAGAAAALPGAAAAAPMLPDGRGWELVSPLASRGVDYDYAWSIGDDAAVFSTFNDLGSVPVARRTATGWQYERIVVQAPGQAFQGAPYLVNGTGDLARLLVAYSKVDGLSSTDSLARRDADGTWHAIGSPARFAGASADLARIVVVPDSTSVAAPDPFPQLESDSDVFLWDDGDVSSIGDDDARVTACGAVVGDGGGPRSVGQTGVSADGATVVLTSKACNDGTDDLAAHVVVWRDGVTTDISEPLAGPDGDARWVGSSSDGTVVFFTSSARLSADDGDSDVDLYRWDAATGARTRVNAAAGAAVVSAISSDDGSTAWFAVADGAGDRLWAWRDGSGARALATGASGAFAFDPRNVDEPGSPSSPNSRHTTITPDGDAILWPATGQVAGLGGGPEQLFRATVDGDVDCVSCTPAGTALPGVGLGQPAQRFDAPVPRMSADGAYVFFESSARLLPADTTSAIDVYGWHDGVLSLISDGTDPRGSFLSGVTPRGDVFVRTYAQLLPWDDDDHMKIYSARLGGGFPAPADPRQTCEGDACQPPATPQPGPDAAGSATFDGPADRDEPEGRWAADPAVTTPKLAAAARKRLAAGRAVTLAVRANAAGRVSATVRVRVGRRWLRSSTATRTLTRAGSARFSVRLSARARRALAAHGRLRVQIEVTHADGVATKRTTFVLQQAKTKTTAGRGR